MKGKRARSAITGRFVSWLYAKLHPRTTVVESNSKKEETDPWSSEQPAEWKDGEAPQPLENEAKKKGA